LVKPEREKNNDKQRRELWWRLTRPAMELYRTIENLDRVLFHSFTSKYVCFGFVPNGIVYAGPHVVIAFSEYKYFLILQSNFHDAWVFNNCSTHETRLRYAPTDCFETFPFPEKLPQTLETIGETYYQHRQKIMTKNQEGLTKTYNRFHDPDETDPDILRLRQLHIEMDYAVADAYGWTEYTLETGGLNHDFHPTKQGLRYTISPTARQDILDRLLLLNHRRYQEEVALGLHDKGKKSGKTKGKKSKTLEGQGELF
jgi:hypothetical protein